MGLINYSNESNASPYIAKEESKWIPLFIVQFSEKRMNDFSQLRHEMCEINQLYKEITLPM